MYSATDSLLATDDGWNNETDSETLTESTSSFHNNTTSDIISSPRKYVKRLSGLCKDLQIPAVIIGSLKERDSLVRYRSLDTLTKNSNEISPLIPKTQTDHDIGISKSSPVINLAWNDEIMSSGGSAMEVTNWDKVIQRDENESVSVYPKVTEEEQATMLFKSTSASIKAVHAANTFISEICLTDAVTTNTDNERFNSNLNVMIGDIGTVEVVGNATSARLKNVELSNLYRTNNVIEEPEVILKILNAILEKTDTERSAATINVEKTEKGTTEPTTKPSGTVVMDPTFAPASLTVREVMHPMTEVKFAETDNIKPTNLPKALNNPEGTETITETLDIMSKENTTSATIDISDRKTAMVIPTIKCAETDNMKSLKTPTTSIVTLQALDVVNKTKPISVKVSPTIPPKKLFPKVSKAAPSGTTTMKLNSKVTSKTNVTPAKTVAVDPTQKKFNTILPARTGTSITKPTITVTTNSEECVNNITSTGSNVNGALTPISKSNYISLTKTGSTKNVSKRPISSIANKSPRVTPGKLNTKITLEVTSKSPSLKVSPTSSGVSPKTPTNKILSALTTGTLKSGNVTPKIATGARTGNKTAPKTPNHVTNVLKPIINRTPKTPNVTGSARKSSKNVASKDSRNVSKRPISLVASKSPRVTPGKLNTKITLEGTSKSPSLKVLPKSYTSLGVSSKTSTNNILSALTTGTLKSGSVTPKTATGARSGNKTAPRTPNHVAITNVLKPIIINRTPKTPKVTGSVIKSSKNVTSKVGIKPSNNVTPKTRNISTTSKLTKSYISTTVSVGVPLLNNVSKTPNVTKTIKLPIKVTPRNTPKTYKVTSDAVTGKTPNTSTTNKFIKSTESTVMEVGISLSDTVSSKTPNGRKILKHVTPKDSPKTPNATDKFTKSHNSTAIGVGISLSENVSPKTPNVTEIVKHATPENTSKTPNSNGTPQSSNNSTPYKHSKSPVSIAIGLGVPFSNNVSPKSPHIKEILKLAMSITPKNPYKTQNATTNNVTPNSPSVTTPKTYVELCNKVSTTISPVNSTGKINANNDTDTQMGEERKKVLIRQVRRSLDLYLDSTFTVPRDSPGCCISEKCCPGCYISKKIL